jgi:arabinogalactan oligomer/maltooligosaccharide transport system permease protein
MSTIIDNEVTDSDVSEKKPSRRTQQAARIAEAASAGIRGILLKIVMLGIVDAIEIKGGGDAASATGGDHLNHRVG